METVHRLIEDEFYHVESFSSRSNFLAKATAYNLWFNVARKNSYKNHQTSWQIIAKSKNKVNPNIAILPPVFLDNIWKIELDFFGNRMYYVTQYSKCYKFETEPILVDSMHLLLDLSFQTFF